MSGPHSDYAPLIALVNNYMGGVSAQLGSAAAVKSVVFNGFGTRVSDSDASAIAAHIDGGHMSWAEAFIYCISLTDDLGKTLDNRATAAHDFVTNLSNAGKADLYSGPAVFQAVKNLLQGIGAGTVSLDKAKDGLAALATNLHATGIQSAVVDGYVKGATVFADANGNGVQDTGEWSTTTDASGNYLLPANATGGKIIASGGTDIMTGKPFQGVLTAPLGATVVNPLTTLVQALLESGAASGPEAAANAVQQALGLPAGINLLSYDPLAVLTNVGASAADQSAALAVQAAALQVVNVISQVGAAINAGSSATPLSAGNAVIAALATAAAAGTPLNLTDAATLAGIVQDAASAAGATGVAGMAQDLASIAAASNSAAANAENITQLAQSAVVAQGDAITAIANGVSGGNLDSAVSGYTGTALNQQINQAQPGEIAPGVDVPPPVTPPSGGSGGGGGTPPTTFTVTETSGAITFGGTATGAITLTTDGTNLTFTRGGIEATTKPLLADVAAGGIAASPGVTLAAATLATTGLAAKLADGAATLGAVTTDQGDVVTHIAKVAADGVASITLTGAQFKTLSDASALGKLTDGGVSISGNVTDADEVAAIIDNLSEITAGGIGQITLTAAQLATAGLAAKLADGAATLDAVTGNQADVVTHIAKVAANGVASITLTGAQFKTLSDASALGQLTDGGVTISGNVTHDGGEGASIMGSLEKITDGGIGQISLTAHALVMPGMAAKLADGAVTLVHHVDSVQGGVIDLIDKVAANGVPSIVLTGAQFKMLSDANKLGKLTDGGVTISGDVTNADEVAAIVSGIAEIFNFGLLNHVAITSAVSAAGITALFGKYAGTSATVDASGMDDSQLAAVFSNLDKISAGGLTNVTLADDAAVLEAASFIAHHAMANDTITLTNGAITTAHNQVMDNITKFKANQITQLTIDNEHMLQLQAAMVADDAIASGAIQLTHGTITDAAYSTVVQNIDKLAANTVTAISLIGSDTTAALLGKAALSNGSVTVGVARDDPAKTAVLGALDKIADGGITETVLTGAEFSTAFASHSTKFADGCVEMTGAVIEVQAASIANHIDKILLGGLGSGVTLALNSTLTGAQLSALLGGTKLTADASVNVDTTGMIPDQLLAVGAGIAKVDALTLTSTTGVTAAWNVVTGISLSVSGADAATDHLIVAGAGDSEMVDLQNIGTANASIVFEGKAGNDMAQFKQDARAVLAQATVGDSGTFVTPSSNAIATSGFDIVHGFNAGDAIQLSAAYSGAADEASGLVATAVTGDDLSSVILADNSVHVIWGAFDQGTGTFEGNGSGSDALVVYDADASAETAYEAVVLVGGGGLSATGGNAGLIAFS